MEKRSNWKIGDIICKKETLELYEVADIIQQSDYTAIHIENLTTKLGMSYPLLFMDKYFTHLGNSKYWKVLYGTKNKNSTN
jgi:hypothetical protein